MRRYLAGSLYLLLLCGLLLILLSLNGWLEFRRTQQGLLQILMEQGVAYLEGREREIKAIFARLERLEQESTPNPPLPSPYGDLLTLDSAIADHLMDFALDLDRQEKDRTLDPQHLSRIMRVENLSRVEFWDPSGTRRFVQGGLSQPIDSSIRRALLHNQGTVVLDDFLRGSPIRPHYSLGVRRQRGEGFLVLSLGRSEMQSLRFRFLLEGSRESPPPGSGLRYLILQGQDPLFLIPEDPLSMGETGSDPFLMEARKESTPRSRTFKISPKEEVFEVVRSLSFGQREPHHLLRVGLSLGPTKGILRQIKRGLVLQFSLLAIFGLIAAFALFWLQNRHLHRLRAMEGRIQMAEKLSSLGELAAGLAHEIRNPLNAISMGIQRLKREIPGLSGERSEAEGLLEVILNEVKRLNSLVEKFLGLSRPAQISREQGDLVEVIFEILRLLEEEAKERKIQLRASIASDLPPLLMDRGRIREAFLNLIRNGMEAMDRGGTLEVAVRRLPDQLLEVTFSDTGGGIPESMRHKIFDPYYTTKKGGLGLGLPLAYQVIRAHGGRISVESQEGKGTRIRVILPLGSGGEG